MLLLLLLLLSLSLFKTRVLKQFLHRCTPLATVLGISLIIIAHFFAMIVFCRMKVETDAEKEVLHKLDANFMSDKEDGEDDQSGLWTVRSPAWRSRRLTSLINSLQQRVEAKSTSSHPSNPRLQGEPSACQPPPSSPAWAVSIIREPDGSPEAPEDPPSPQLPSQYFSPRRGNNDDGDDGG